MNRILATAAFALVSTASAATWDFDPAHSQATFTVKHMMVTNVTGEFKKFSGKVNLDESDITKSTVEATIDANSIDTNEPKRDAHLKSAEFFNTAKCPKITFKSKKVEKAGDKKLKVTGDLTMNCVTKQAVLEVDGPTPEMKGPWGNTVRAASATTMLDRTAYNLNWNKALEAGGVLVGNDVKVNLELQLVPSAKQGEAAAKKEAKSVEKAAEKKGGKKK